MDGEITLLCREYTIFRNYPNAQALAAIPEGTIMGPVLKVHVVTLLHGYGIQVAIPSIANPTYTSYVVNDPEKQSVLKRSAHRTSWISKKWTMWRKKRRLAQQGILWQLFQQSASQSIPVDTKNHSYDMKRKCTDHSRAFTRWRILSNCSIQRWLQKCCVIMIKKKDKPMVRDICDTIRPTLVRAFAWEEARDFDDRYWLMLIQEGSKKMRIEYCEDKNGSLCYLRAIQGHSGGIPIKSRIGELTHLFPTIGRNTSTTEEFRGIFNPFWGVDWFWEDKRNTETRQSVFCTALNPFGQETEEELRSLDYTVPQKQYNETHWKRNQDAVYWIKLSRAQDQGFRFWQTK